MPRDQYPTVGEESLHGVARTTLDSPDPTPEQLARRLRSVAYLRRLQVPVFESLPVVEDVSTLESRTATEIAQRCVAVAICAVKGETADHQLAQQLLDQYQARPFLSPAEAAFMADAAPSQQQFVDAAWGYEVVHVLLWSLGYVDEIRPPNKICDVPTEVGIVRDHGSAAGLAASAHPRSLAGC